MVQCIDTGGFGGFEADGRGDPKGSNGIRKQTSIRGWSNKATVRYNPLKSMVWSAGSLSIDSELVAYPGMTVATSYLVLAAKPSVTNQGEDALDVTVESLIKTTKDHVW
jgi:hypothetical protein